MGMGSNSFANRSLRIISPITTPSFPDLGEIGQYIKCWFRANSTSWRTLSQPHKLLLGNITKSSESYSTILSSLLLNDGGEHGKTSECWQTLGSFLSSYLFSLMECCELLCGESPVARIGSLKSRQWGPETCQQPHEWPWKRILSHLSLEMTAALDSGLVRDPDPITQPRHTQFPNPQQLGVINVYCFKLPSFAMICSTAVGNATDLNFSSGGRSSLRGNNLNYFWD